ncbi:unnamed protein product [Candidula unifasciata]|uniref:Uncharacterized protein n=1 Tax=Candidula unifasciata TaxID=100452 RepID=A0A8S4A3R2_9EUPU|nr:unnamed protein product [Candidula unifasciata]
MKFLCFFATLMTVAIASAPRESAEINKRLLGLLSGSDEGRLDESGIADLTKSLQGKTTEPEIYAEFRKYPTNILCKRCDAIKNRKYNAACKKYCAEQKTKAEKTSMAG